MSSTAPSPINRALIGIAAAIPLLGVVVGQPWLVSLGGLLAIGVFAARAWRERGEASARIRRTTGTVALGVLLFTWLNGWVRSEDPLMYLPLGLLNGFAIGNLLRYWLVHRSRVAQAGPSR